MHGLVGGSDTQFTDTQFYSEVTDVRFILCRPLREFRPSFSVTRALNKMRPDRRFRHPFLNDRVEEGRIFIAANKRHVC